MVVDVEQRAADRRQGDAHRHQDNQPARPAGHDHEHDHRGDRQRGQDPAGLAEHHQRSEHQRTGRPDAGEHLVAGLLSQRDAGPEAEQEVAGLSVDVAQRIPQATAEEHARGVPVSHPHDHVEPHAEHAGRGEAQRDPALAPPAHQQHQGEQSRRVERPAPGVVERPIGRLRPGRGDPAPEPQEGEAADREGRHEPRPPGPGDDQREHEREHADRDRAPDREVVEAADERAHSRRRAHKRQQDDPHRSRRDHAPAPPRPPARRLGGGWRAHAAGGQLVDRASHAGGALSGA